MGQTSRYRWRDFVALPEDDLRELLDGRLEAFDMPTKWHERMVAWLIMALGPWCERRGWAVLGSNYRVRISDKRGVKPDVQVLSEGTWGAAGEQGLESGRPELVIEIVSPTSRAHDRVTKVNWYASIGVPEYWIVDADARTLECLKLDGDTYRLAQNAAGDVVFKPRSFRGVSIDLAAFWRLRK
ncbi:MAG: hypothetical protein AMXMBFR34_14550 [Myxococcaceae bacterium]